MKRVLGLLGGYSISVITTAAVGLLVIPFVIRTTGDSGWSSFAVGQSAGSVAGVLIALGWGISGPTLIAASSGPDQVAIARASLISRIIISPPVLILSSIAAWLLAPGDPIAAVLSCLATSTVGLGMTWVFVGQGRPTELFVLDTLPRAASTVVGGAALLVTGNLWTLAACQLVGGLIAVTVSSVNSTAPRAHLPGRTWSVRVGIRETRSQIYPSITAITASIYLALPTLVVAATAPQATGAYALADRLGRFSLMALTPFGQWLQGWVPRLGRHHTDTPARIKKGLNAATVAGIGAGIGVASLGPWLAHLLGGSHVSVTFALAAFVGISVAMSTISRASGMAGLQTLGMSKAVAISAVVGAAIGIPLLLVSVPVYGAVGAAAAVAAAETGVTLAQGIRLRRVLAGIAAHG